MRKYLEKHTHMKGNRLKYDFMPPMQEIIEKPAHIGGSIIIFSIFALIATAIIWAAFMELDEVIIVTGVTEPEGKMGVVQSHTGGVVASIDATVGSLIQEGDTLVTLKQETAKIDVQELNHNIALLTAQKDVYERIYNEEALEDIDADEYGDYAWEINCIIEEQKIYDNNVKVLEMQAKDAVSKEEAQLQIDNYILNRKLEIAVQISACTTKIREGNVAVEKSAISMAAGAISATETGYITELAVTTPGQVVTSSQVIAYLVPEDAVLLLQCYVANKDISQISIGQDVQIKWSAYPYSRHGTTAGTVSYISPAAAFSEQMGYVYTIHVAFENEDDAKQFLPGMNAVVEIQAGKRTVLEYFLEPITEGLDNSLKEPE